MGKQKILIVEDEKQISDILKFNVIKEGFEVETAFDGEEGYKKALEGKPDLILLDVMLPLMNGFDVCKKVREKSNVPIIMLTARDEEFDKVFGLDLGADDYIAKPFSMKELMARIKANIRRVSYEKDSSVNMGVSEFGRISIDTSKYVAEKDGNDLELTIREFELIKYLADRLGKVVSREELLKEVWGFEYYGDLRTVDVTIRRLREKVEDDASSPDFIVTKRGVGYYFEASK